MFADLEDLQVPNKAKPLVLLSSFKACSRTLQPLQDPQETLKQRGAYLAGNAPVKRIDQTTLIVAGQLLSAPFPSHVMLDTQAGLILWQAASQAWIPETFGDRFPQV